MKAPFIFLAALLFSIFSYGQKTFSLEDKDHLMVSEDGKISRAKTAGAWQNYFSAKINVKLKEGDFYTFKSSDGNRFMMGLSVTDENYAYQK